MGNAVRDVLFLFFSCGFFFLPWISSIRYMVCCNSLLLNFFFLPTVARRGPLRVRALVWVRCPLTATLCDGAARDTSRYPSGALYPSTFLAQVTSTYIFVYNILDFGDLLVGKGLSPLGSITPA